MPPTHRSPKSGSRLNSAASEGPSPETGNGASSISPAAPPAGPALARLARGAGKLPPPRAPGFAEVRPALAAVAPLHPVPPHAAAIAPQRTPGNTHRGNRWLNIVLALFAIPVILLAIWPSVARNTLEPATVSAFTKLAQSDWVTRVLAVGNVSPSGVDATSLTTEEALRRAEQAIFERGDAPNVAERRFWLRKSIAKLLAEPESRWAATQLGAMQAASASPAGKPDYQAAKTLWEIASASGDPVATCFVAQLYEFGLGVQPNMDHAKQWYERAIESGGCDRKHEAPGPALTN